MKHKEIESLKNVVGYVSERILAKPDHILTKDIRILQTYLKDISQGDGNVKQRDFDELWKLYRNRVGKKAAERHFFGTVKRSADLEKIKVALANYNESKNVRSGFIQGGSRWFNDWQSWVEPTPEMMGGAVADKTRSESEKQKFLSGK